MNGHLTGGHLLGLAQGHSFLCRLASSDIRQDITTSCQNNQIAIVTHLHTPVSCTLYLVHPLSLPHWRSRCDSSKTYTAYYRRIYVATLTCLSTYLSYLSPCQLFYHSIKQNIYPY